MAITNNKPPRVPPVPNTSPSGPPSPNGVIPVRHHQPVPHALSRTKTPKGKNKIKRDIETKDSIPQTGNLPERKWPIRASPQDGCGLLYL